MSRLLPTVLVALALAAGGTLAACGSDDSSSSGTTAAAPTTPATGQSDPATTTPANTGGATADAGQTGTVEISMKDIAFDPKDVDVKLGQTVKWTNDDTVSHNAVATSGATFKSDIFGQGGTYEYKPEKVGKIEYVCTLHPGMDGTLNVTE